MSSLREAVSPKPTKSQIARKRRLRRIFRKHNKPLEGLSDSLQLFEGDKKRAKRQQLRQQNEKQQKSSIYDISPLYAPKLHFNNELFQNVINQTLTLLKHHEVTFLGTVYDENGEKIWNTEFTPGFRKEQDFLNYIDNLGERYDLSHWTFTGEINYQRPEFELINRSKFGHGSLFFSIQEYETENVFIPTSDNCFFKCAKKIYPDLNHEEFNSWFFTASKVQKGQMTLSLINKFNKKFNKSITWYNETDRHLYPKVYSKTSPDKVLFLHDKHYCLINKNNKSKAIKELKANFIKTWKQVDERCTETKQFKTSIRNPKEDSTYVYDLETYRDIDGYAIPYACACVRVSKLKQSLNKYLDNSSPVPEELEERVCNYVNVFTGLDCIEQMFKFLGKLSDTKLTLIAHNGSKFDSYLVLQKFNPSKPPIKSAAGLVSLSFTNPYTSESLQRKCKTTFNKKQKMLGKKIIQNTENKFLQSLTFRCSFNHIKSSLANMGKSFKIPSNLQKTSVDHTEITEDNWEQKQSEWEPYLRKDIVSLGTVVIKYSRVMEQLIGLNMTSSISSPSLSFKGWIKQSKEPIYSHTDKFTRAFIRRAVKGGRVSANIQKYESPIMKEIISQLKQHFHTTETNICELMKLYTQSKFKLKNLNLDDVLMNFDGVSLYPSAMADNNSEYPKCESARMFNQQEEQKFLEQFNNQSFRLKTGIFKVKYINPSNLFFQHSAIKEKIKNYEVCRFRNGKITDTLTSVDIQEIVRSGGTILKIYEGIVYENNFKISPFKSYIEKLFNQRLEAKKQKDEVQDSLIKLLMNSLYGKTVQKDITKTGHLWNRNTLKTNFDERIYSYQKLMNDLYFVETEDFELEMNTDKSRDKSRDKSMDDFTSYMPSHLGAFILSHSKRIMNNFIECIDGFKQPKIYYGDTDSIYITKDNWEVLNKNNHVGDKLGQGKNDYGEGGIVFGLYLAPKVKYNIVLNEDYTLSEKTTFKGYSKEVLKVEDFFSLAAGELVQQEMPKTWKKSMETGIQIPNVDDKQLKKFKADINLLKRKKPDSNYIMWPYNSKNECDYIQDNKIDEVDIKYSSFVIEESIFVDI